MTVFGNVLSYGLGVGAVACLLVAVVRITLSTRRTASNPRDTAEPATPAREDSSRTHPPATAPAATAASAPSGRPHPDIHP